MKTPAQNALLLYYYITGMAYLDRSINALT